MEDVGIPAGQFAREVEEESASSGFIGLKLLLSVCKWIDFFEYVPSARATKRCHYYDPENNPACTFGVWHPLAAEKLLTYYINSASDRDAFQTGFVRIRGLERNDCGELKAY
ncbi:unnamed protein product [Callosobruchus maculatus]|uniref:Uncharacterized protein n=1 Tax=Callosobruchus maculatus TaxID=64391 RepID=A0A653DNE3_CALMS|nr:unnamed protein product [Callosobruchus maculatus]